MTHRHTSDIVISTVVLNWNRADLLKKTVDSYLRTVSTPYELFIIDNASTDESVSYIKTVCKDHPRHHAILLNKNFGGEALNRGMEKAHGSLLHLSENDLEYLPDWDREILSKFEAFSNLGQLSLFSPFHQVELGEVWTDRAAVRMVSGNAVVFRALSNVTTSSVIRHSVWEKGVRWKSHGTQTYWSPDDCAFSSDVKKLGYDVAWNDRYLVVNWGHNAVEMVKRLEYYLNNAAGKQYLGVAGLTCALTDHGFNVTKKNEGGYAVERLVPPLESRAARRTALWREWIEQLGLAAAELEQVIPTEASYLLVDDEQFGVELLPGRQGVPFIEADGRYWGTPVDDEMAIRELERMRAVGVRFIVLMWPCFWWLNYYHKFAEHLRASFRCVLENERLIVFDLRPAKPASGDTAS